MILHISSERMDRVRSRMYSLGSFESGPELKPEPQEGDTVYHILDGERSVCSDCGKEFDSIDVNSPVDIQNLKVRMVNP